MMPTKIAIVGAGYVADMYVCTLPNHPNLDLVGVYDQDEERTKLHADRWRVPSFSSLDTLVNNSGAEIILNLTNPRSHFEVTKFCLESNKHVYSEKPLGMTVEEGRELTEIAKSRGLLLGAAPCNWMSESLATIKREISVGRIGNVRLVYANFDDGLIAPTMEPWNWRNRAGIPWPARDEFEVGCTFEHAGYVLTWLVHLFGAATSVTSHASCQLPDKGIHVSKMAPDFTVGCINFKHDIVARVTCGLVAPLDKSFVVVGDKGIIYTNSVRSDIGPIFFQTLPPKGRMGSLERRVNQIRRFLEAALPITLWSGRNWQFRRKLNLVRRPPKHLVSPGKPVDFLRGPADIAASLTENRTPNTQSRFALHILELTYLLQNPANAATPTTTHF